MSLHTLGWYVSAVLFLVLSLCLVRYSRFKRATVRRVLALRVALADARRELRSAK